MTKKGKNGSGDLKNNGHNISTFCSTCGETVVKGAKKCSNPECLSKGQEFNLNRIYCARCKKYIVITNDNRCSNCNFKLHGCIANCYKQVMH